jgi:hypothetical protein
MGLSTRVDMGAAMRTLAKNHGVRIEEVKIAGVSDVLEALKTMSPAAENACVAASLVTVESDLPRLLERAQAWAGGNIERIEQLRGPAEVDTCRAALDAGSGPADVTARIRARWLGVFEKNLQGRGSTIAVVNFDMLLERGGLLDQLRAKGYQVDAPGDK